MIIGNLTPGYVELPLRGRPSFVYTMVNQNGVAVSTDGVEVRFKIYVNPDDPEASPLISKDVFEGGGLVAMAPSSSGQIIVDLSAAEAALISPQRLYSFVAEYLNLDTEQILLTNTGHLIAAVNCINLVQQETDSMSLSTRFINSLTLTGAQGGDGYLDGVVTVNQSVPATVEFNPSAGGPPQKWVLETGTDATDLDNGLLRPLDYNGTTNRKRWRQIS